MRSNGISDLGCIVSTSDFDGAMYVHV